MRLSRLLTAAAIGPMAGCSLVDPSMVDGITNPATAPAIITGATEAVTAASQGDIGPLVAALQFLGPTGQWIGLALSGLMAIPRTRGHLLNAAASVAKAFGAKHSSQASADAAKLA